MPGFIPTQGEYDIEYAVPSSAFSRNDVLVLDSASSVSGWDVLGVGEVFGVALQDSVDSIRNRVCVAIPRADTIFLASMATTGINPSVGSRVDIILDGNGRPLVTSSALTQRVVVVRPPSGLPYGVANQSVESKCYVKFLRQGDSLSSVVLG
jgi:hypothetical protein